MDLPTLLLVAGLSLVVLLASVAAMAVSVIFKRPCLRGSCGGREVLDAQGHELTCDTCPNKKRHHA